MSSTAGASLDMEVDVAVTGRHAADPKVAETQAIPPPEPIEAGGLVGPGHSGGLPVNIREIDWADNLDGLLGLLEDSPNQQAKAFIKSQVEAAEEAVKTGLRRGRSA